MRIVFISFLLCFVFNSELFSITLSDSSEISLLTCSPGQDLYSIFGHSAIRVQDKAKNLDKVYNYGTFNFNTPNFYLKFANGKLDYMLSAGQYKYFLSAYFREERSVIEQVLNLTQEEKQNLFGALEYNTQPENKYYRYDFFFDNCATRIRDIVLQNIKGEINYKIENTSEKTFRVLLHEYLNNLPWTRDGIDLLLGSKTDRITSPYEQMLLPDYMKTYFSHAEILRNNQKQPLVLKTRKLLNFNHPTPNSNIWVSPEFVFWLLFSILVLVFFYELKNKIHFMWIDMALLILSGLAGMLFSYLWFVTEHTVTGNNFNLMWALPTNVILAFGLGRLNTSRFYRKLLLVTFILCIGLVMTKWIIPQTLPTIVFPFALIISIRLGRLYFWRQ
ncbi:DUF4105 domain-containing protein [Marinilabiliaceae bacterium JC017]|nr:DUF4105 domain-containing protein [Marinilabiliaceae bacterium JC017]